MFITNLAYYRLIILVHTKVEILCQKLTSENKVCRLCVDLMTLCFLHMLQIHYVQHSEETLKNIAVRFLYF